MRRISSLILALAAVLAVGSPVAATQRPMVLDFQKQWVAPDHYAGTLAGGGTIEMRLFDKRVIGRTQHFSARVDVVAGARSFTALVSGQITFSTGRVALHGTVLDGWLAGAQVREESTLVDPATGAFNGTIQIMPASS